MARIKFYDKISNQWEYADANNIDSSSNIAIDHTLSKEGQAADAKAVGDALANKQPKGNYLTEVPSGYVTDEELNSKGYLTEHQDLTDYAKKTDIPSIPVQSVNGKTGAVSIGASDVGADPSGTANSAVSAHNTSPDSHADIRELISELSGQNLNPVAKTADMTQPVGADADGLLWTVPAGDDAYFEITAGGALAAKGEPINVVVGSIWNGDHGVNDYFDTGYHNSAKWNADWAGKIRNIPSGTYYSSYGYIHSEPYRGKVYFRLICKGEYGTTDAYRPCVVVSDTNELQSATALTCLDGTMHRSVATLTEGATTYYVHVWEYTIPDGQNGWVLMTPDDSVYVKTEFALPYQGMFSVNPLDDPLQNLGGGSGGEVVKIKDAYSYGFYANLLQDGTFHALFREHFYALAPAIGLMQTFGKSWYAAGDSNHAYSGGDGQTTDGWLTDINKYLGFARIVNAGYAGSTWSGTTGGGGIKRITDLIAAGTAYDVVTLAWGTNTEESGAIGDDASNAEGATMVAAMKWGISALREAFPNTVIGVIIPPPKGAEGEIDSVADLMVQVCELLHVPYVDMRRYVALDDLGSDKVHLTSGGARKYGAALGSFVRAICPYGDPL